MKRIINKGRNTIIPTRNTKKYIDNRNKIFLDNVFVRSNLPKCKYCSKDVYRARANQPFLMHNNATADHVYPNGDIRRLIGNNDLKVVLSCYECNQIRNETYQRERKEYYWAMAPQVCEVNIINLVLNQAN